MVFRPVDGNYSADNFCINYKIVPTKNRKRIFGNMIDPAGEADIVSFLKGLVRGLQPYAKKKSIKLDFTFSKNEIRLCYAEKELNAGLTKLIASIIDYMPDNNTLYLQAGIVEKEGAKYVSLQIKNTGINLKMVTAIIKSTSLPVTLFSSDSNETTYEVCYSLNPFLNKQVTANGNTINYTSMVNRIQNYFSRLNNPIARLSESKPKEAAFLTRINQCILNNISDERFDANALSTAMAMSRAQLLRRLKSLTGNSPGFYIKAMRLAKAKELLETTELTVSETAFRTGFGTPSNFSKVFAEKYGITPSQFRRINPNATNK
jgi:AraC-like DNA-binding protein